MLAIIVSWIVISLILLSYGDMFISIYNRLCNKKEVYNIFETLTLGMGFVLLPVSFLSLFLPTNHWTLLALLIAAIIYCWLSRQRLNQFFLKTKDFLNQTSTLKLLVLSLSVFALFTYILWDSAFFDSMYYHYQNIRWNEEFSVVPGLGNLEDRFAFNSNFLLLSALFTFRFLFGEPLYLLQTVLFLYLMLWVQYEVIKSNYTADRIILLVVFFFFFLLNAEYVSDTSTDIIPNICIFYIIAKFTLYPNLITYNKLYLFTIPLILITFKISVIPFSLIGLYLLFKTFRQKEYSTILFLVTIPFLIIVLWLVRNVIISGYLVYPLSKIDLFCFDWKMPSGIADLQQSYIFNYARGVFIDLSSFSFFLRGANITQFKIFFLNNIIIVFSYLMIIISPLLVLFKHFRERIFSFDYNYIIYISALLSFIYWLLTAPDYRFNTGCICGLLFWIAAYIFSQKKVAKIAISKQGQFVHIAVIICILVLATTRSKNYYNLLISQYSPTSDFSTSSIFIKPFSAKHQKRIKNIEEGFNNYTIGNQTIFLTKDKFGRGLDKLPSTLDISPKLINSEGKIQNVNTIEFRGSSLQEGFRTKRNYVDSINAEAKKVIRLKYNN